MLTGILIFAIIALLGVLSHRRSRLEERVYKNVPISDWITIFIFPIFFYTGWVFMVRNIISRQSVEILPLDDIDIIVLTCLFMVYGFVGNSIHFTGKILWRYLKDHRSMAYKVNEMFHGKFSHYLVDISSSFIIFMLTILEINHPLNFPFNLSYQTIIILLGLILGLSMRRYVFFTNEWFGGYNKPIFFIVASLLVVLIGLFKVCKLAISLYPVSLFVISGLCSFVAAFIIRQIFIFSKLDEKRKLRFLAKLLSI
jgi:hypothetical protein